MNRREILSLISGLVIGLLAGMVLIGSSDDLRSSIFGTTASDTKSSTVSEDDFAYYLVRLTAAQDWLAEKYPETSADVIGAVDTLNRLEVLSREDLLTAIEAAESVLPQMFAALTNAENPADLKIEPDNQLSVCLGLDDNPFNLDETGKPAEPAMYLYVTIPQAAAKDLTMPDDPDAWQKLDQPKTNDLYWQLLACYPPEETAS